MMITYKICKALIWKPKYSKHYITFVFIDSHFLIDIALVKVSNDFHLSKDSGHYFDLIVLKFSDLLSIVDNSLPIETFSPQLLGHYTLPLVFLPHLWESFSVSSDSNYSNILGPLHFRFFLHR